MKNLKWPAVAVMLIIAFFALRWVLNVIARPAPPNIGDGALFSGWAAGGQLYPQGVAVYPWSPPRPRQRGPRPWRGTSYAGRG